MKPKDLARLKEIERLAREFCEAEIKLPEIQRKYVEKHGKGYEPGWTRESFFRYRVKKLEHLRPIKRRRNRALNALKKLLCDWEPGKRGPKG